MIEVVTFGAEGAGFPESQGLPGVEIVDLAPFCARRFRRRRVDPGRARQFRWPRRPVNETLQVSGVCPLQGLLTRWDELFGEAVVQEAAHPCAFRKRRTH